MMTLARRRPGRVVRLLPRLTLAAAMAGMLMAQPTHLAAVEDAPEQPSSLGEATLYHLSFATNLSGAPIEEGDVFPVGVPRVLTLLGWDRAPVGTEFRLRLFQGDRLVFEQARTVRTRTKSGYVFNYSPPGGVPAGEYSAQLDYNGVPEEVATFRVVEGAGGTQPSGSRQGTGSGRSGPIGYADPSSVLVVTRASVLRAELGESAWQQVAAAAARVGTVVDLEADGVTRSDPAATIAEVQRLLRAGSYRYLLILGNDDAVPYARVANPFAADERKALEGWQLPADWLPSDDPYTDLDGDQWATPDLATARIPSSDDARLLLTQLGEVSVPDGGTFALVNQKRRSQAGAVLETIDDAVFVDGYYVPPTEAGEIPATDAARARYTYILLHGIGVTTDAWSGDIVSWRPRDPNDLTGEFEVGHGGQVDGMTVAVAGAGGVVNVGACYGAWTLDTVQEPVHKTADNSLALRYLRAGTRAFVGDTHLSYSTSITPEGPFVGRTGFEVVFWRTMLAGASPIDAFQEAKRRVSAVIGEAIAQGDGETAALNLKTLHMMVYLGRP
ncbi:MAG TPA: C25 family cysteine peptidase [Candidatus Limnocylindrales bacterium]|nr:C25 family cysteine peptidase [Candidatus Limnocylindrales bacterium]